MITNDYFKRPRKKAWAGAAIGAVVGLGSAIFGASKQKKVQEQQMKLQQAMEARNVGLTSAANLTQVYSNSDELDEEFRNRFLRYGGRRKAEWGAEDTTALINSLGNASSNIATNIIGRAQQQGIYPNAIKPIVNNNDNEAVYDSAGRSNFLNNYYRTSALRCGGGRKMGRR